MSKLNSRNMSSMESTIGGSSNCIAEIKETCDETTLHSEEEPDTPGALQSVVIAMEDDEQPMEVQLKNASFLSSPNSAKVSSKGSGEELRQSVDRVTGSPTSSCEGGESSMSKTAILRNIFFSQIASSSKEKN